MDRARKLVGAFTLLEVLVAVAILGLSLTAIFSSQAGAIRVGARARSISTATLLARCKMGEVEEEMLNEGFPAVHAEGTDECCEDGESPGFECDWTVDRVTMPETMMLGEEDGDPLGLGGEDPSAATSTANVTDALSGGAGGDIVGDMAMQYAFPLLRPAIEEQVRRATVTVRWREGSAERSFSVVQFIVQDQGTSVPGATPGSAGATPTTPTVPGNPLLPRTPVIPLPPSGGFGR